jgi:hypothetical protein
MGSSPFGFEVVPIDEKRTEKVYQMSINKTTKSLNGLVFEIAYKRLKLSPTERIVFQRLLGFLIRNDKPFPYSNVSLAEITGFDKRTIVRTLEKLEKNRLIERIGFTTYRKFKRGRILNKILSLTTSRLKNELNKSSTLATLCRHKLNTSDIRPSNKTSLSSKHKERHSSFSLEAQLQYNNYIQDKKALIKLKLLPESTQILSIHEWSLLIGENTV